jgi:hypothetical protein
MDKEFETNFFSSSHRLIKQLVLPYDTNGRISKRAQDSAHESQLFNFKQQQQQQQPLSLRTNTNILDILITSHPFLIANIQVCSLIHP